MKIYKHLCKDLCLDGLNSYLKKKNNQTVIYWTKFNTVCIWDGYNLRSARILPFLHVHFFKEDPLSPLSPLYTQTPRSLFVELFELVLRLPFGLLNSKISGYVFLEKFRGGLCTEVLTFLDQKKGKNAINEKYFTKHAKKVGLGTCLRVRIS